VAVFCVVLGVLVNTKSGRRPKQIEIFRHALAAGAFALAAIASTAPASAATVTDHVVFSVTGSYTTQSVPGGYHNGSASGSFDITFDPTLLNPSSGIGAQPLAGVINNLVYTVSDPFFGGDITGSLNAITEFTYAYGVLTLYSDYANDHDKDFPGIADIVIGINGFAPPPSAASSVWYSQDAFGNTLTASGTASITQQENPIGETPLPAGLPLFASGLGALGLLGWRRKKKAASRAA
jgi:hypothetical protein